MILVAKLDALSSEDLEALRLIIRRKLEMRWEAAEKKEKQGGK